MRSRHTSAFLRALISIWMVSSYDLPTMRPKRSYIPPIHATAALQSNKPTDQTAIPSNVYNIEVIVKEEKYEVYQ